MLNGSGVREALSKEVHGDEIPKEMAVGGEEGVGQVRRLEDKETL